MTPPTQNGRLFLCLAALCIGIVMTIGCFQGFFSPAFVTVPKHSVAEQTFVKPESALTDSIQGKTGETSANRVTARTVSRPPNRFEQSLMKEAVMLAQRSEDLSDQGLTVETRLWRTGFKYPLIREQVWLKLSAVERSVVRREYSVGDHVMIKFPTGMDNEVIHEWARKRGFYVRHDLQTTSVKLIATAEVGLDTTETILKVFAEDFPSPLAPKAAIAEPDYLVFPTLVPDDTSFSNLWGLNNTGQTGGVVDADIDAPEAWSVTTGSREVLVGVIDTGVSRTHPDLAANMWSNPGEIAGNGVDDDGNGFVDDVNGWDFFSNDKDPTDEDNHGTHCAGTIGAVGNNRAGVSGVCWQVSMVGIRFLGSSGGTTSDAIESVNYATGLGVHLTSNSWGGGGMSALLKEAIDDAGAQEILFVAAAGNDGADNDSTPNYPSNYASENIIAVASSTASDTRSSFSNFGLSTVDLAAPGSAIYSTIPGPSYATLSGTSMATPHVTGAVALARSIAPLTGAVELKQRVMQTVDRLSAFASNTVSGGRLNAGRLIESVAGPYPLLTVSGVTEMPGGNGDGIENPGESLAIHFSMTNRGTETATDVVARITSSAAAASRYDIIESSVNVGALTPGQTVTGGGNRFLVVADAEVATPYTEEMIVTLQYGSPTELRVQRFNLRLYTSSVVFGRVSDLEDDAALANATVVLEGPSVVSVSTAADGSYSATVTDGTYQVSARAFGYLRSEEVQVLAPPGQTGVNFSLSRPQLRLEPGSVTEELLRGDTLDRVVKMTNHGTAPLEWTLRARSLEDQTNLFELAATAVDTGETPDVAGPRVALSSEVPALTAPLDSLQGVTVGAVFSSLGRSVLRADLEARGARVVTLVPPFAEDTFEEIDVVLLDDTVANLSSTDIQNLRVAVQGGIGLLCEADNSSSLSKASDLLQGTGIRPMSDSYRDLTLTDILPHPITSGVLLLRSVAAGWWAELSGAAVPLVREGDGRVHAAISKLGQGVVVFVGNEITDASNFAIGDGRRFANQIVDGLLAGPEWLAVTPLIGTLAPGAEGSLTLSLDARTVARGMHEAALMISTNIPDESALTVPVTMNVREVPRMVLDVDSVAFGSVIERVTATREIWVYNGGTEDLILQPPVLSGAGAAAYSVLAEERVIASGAQEKLLLSFLPGAPLGLHEATLTLESNDPNTPSVTIQVSGTHVAAPNLLLTPASVRVSLSQGRTTTRTFVIKNTGKGILNVSSEIVFAGSGPTDWVEIEGGESLTLAKGKSGKITLRFHARTYLPSTFTALFRVTSDDPDTPVLDRALVMNTVGAAVPVIEGGGLTFDKTYVGQSQTRNLVITNEGSVNFTIQTALALNRAFRIVAKLPLTIVPGERRAIPVIFSPGATGRIQSSLFIGTNVSSFFQLVPVEGTADRLPAVQVSPTSMTVSVHPGISQTKVINVKNVGGEILDWSLQPVAADASWLSQSSAFTRLTASKLDQISLTFSAAQMPAGSYHSNLTLLTNDPKRPVVTIPIILNVSSQAVLQASPASLDLGEVWKDQLSSLDFDLVNVGNLPLEIRTVTPSSKDLKPGWAGSLTVAPGQSVPLQCNFQSGKLHSFKGTLTLKTDSRITPTLKLGITAKVIEPPKMTVEPGSLTETILPSQTKEGLLEVHNRGDADLNWQAEVVANIDSPSSAGSLGQVLERINARHAELTALIPNRYDFTEGSSGYSIGSGGNNMYNTGNFFSTNLNGGQAVAYSNGLITADINLGSSSRYFTSKQPGLFMLAADLSSVSSFRIRGSLGAGGAGTASGAVLRRHGYMGFFKRVSGASTPSVNHLIILPDRTGLDHTFPANTGLDDHSVTGLPSSTRIYVLVFASKNGGYVTDGEARQIMDKFLQSVVHDADTPWLRVLTADGMTEGDEVSPLGIRMDAGSLSAGTYSGVVRVSGNAPETPEILVPVTLNVPTAAVLAVDPGAIDFGNKPVNGTSTLPVILRNLGNTNLNVTEIAINHPAFTVSGVTTSFSIPAGQTRTAQIRFMPTEAVTYVGQMTLMTDAESGGQTLIPISGNGLPAPLLQVSPQTITLSTRPGVPVSRLITLTNNGTAPLGYTLSNTLTTGTLSRLSGTIEAGGNQVVTLTTVSTATTPPGSSVQSITITSNDPVRPTIGLSYTRIIAAEPTLSVTPSPVSLDPVLLPGSTQRQVILRNTGNAQLVISGVTLPSANLSLLSTTFPILLSSGSTRTVQLSFTPSVPELLTDSLVFNTNNPINPALNVAVTGLAVTPPTITVGPSAVNVSVEEGKQFSTALTVRNDGGTKLNWSASLQPSNASSWLVLGQTSGSTQAGSVSYLSLNLVANNLSTGTLAATVTLTSNAVMNGTVQVPVTMVVKPSELTVSTASISGVSLTGVAGLSSNLGLVARAGESPAWTLSSNVPWIVPSANVGNGSAEVTLAYSSALSEGIHTGQITVSTANVTRVVQVTRTVLARRFSQLLTDHRHDRVIGLVKGTAGGMSVLASIHPVTLAIQNVIALPSDIVGMDMTTDARTLYAISYSGRSITKVDLDDFSLVATKSIPTTSTFGSYYQVQAGRDGVVYYTDAASNPALHVYDFEAGADVSTFYLQGQVGIGDFTVTPDGRTLYARSYTANSTSGTAFLARVDCSTNILTQTAATSAVLVQDSTRYPVLLSANLDTVVTQGHFFSTVNLAGGIQGSLTQDKIYNASAYLDELVTERQIISGEGGEVLQNLPVNTTVTAFSPNQSRLIYQHPSSNVLGTLDTSSLPSIDITSGVPPGSIQNVGFDTLSWSGDPSVVAYDLYLGTNEAEVTEAVYAVSTSFLVSTSSTSFTLGSGQLSLGQTYYWRVDARASDNTVSKGDVWSFRMAQAGSSPERISGYAMPGSVEVQEVSLSILTSGPGVSWTLNSDSSWITLSHASGSGAATVTVFLDPTGLSAGLAFGEVTLTSGTDVIKIPVSLEILGALNIVKMKPDPALPVVYALHREIMSPYSSWLLWVDSVTAEIEHGVRVGNAAVDFTVHAGDDRLYALVEDGRRVQIVQRQSGGLLQSAYAVSPPQVALHATSTGRLVTLSAANALQLRQSGNGTVIGSAQQVLGRDSLTVTSADGSYIYAAVTQSSSNVGLVRYAVTGSGLSFITANYFSGTMESPLLISANATRLIYGRNAYSPTTLSLSASLGQRIHAISADANKVISESAIYSVADPLVNLAPLPFTSQTMALSADGTRLLLYSPVTRTFQSVVIP